MLILLMIIEICNPSHLLGIDTIRLLMIPVGFSQTL